MNSLINLTLKWAKGIALVGTLLAFIGAFYSVKLYQNLRTDVEELLPTTARSIVDLNEVSARLESFDSMVILVFSKDPKGSKKFIDDLAKNLNKVPKTTISAIEYKIDNEIKFFQDRKVLFISLEDLKRIHNYIGDRINYEKQLYNPLNIFRFGKENEIPEPKLDFTALRNHYDSQASNYTRFPGGYYASADEKVRVMVAYMPGKGLDRALLMKDAVEKTVNQMKLSQYAPDLEVKYTGNVQNMLEESAALVEDLELSTVIVLILVTAGMLLFYRNFYATMALVISLFMGTFWTFGVCYFVVGYLNANTAFLASIVIGNGINFGIIFLARYLEERRTGASNIDSLRASIQGTATATGTAALAAALAYGSLMLTSFRGFNQFGVMGFIGMILCWLSSYTLLPAYLTLIDRWRGQKWITQRKTSSHFANASAFLVERFPKAVMAVTFCLIIFSTLALKNIKDGVIETDLSKLRDKRSMEQGSGALYHYIDDIFGHSFSPLVVLPRDREHTRLIAEKFREKKKEEGSTSQFTMIQTIDDFIPDQQPEKIKVLRGIKKILAPKILNRLSPADRELTAQFLNPKAFHPFTEKDLPPVILNRFREKDGSIGKIVLVDKKIEHKADDARELKHFVTTSRDIVDAVAPGSPIAGQLPISFDMYEAIAEDGPKATFFAFIAVFFLIVILFRHLKTISLAVFALVLGVFWLFGIMLGFHLKINFLNFIALPITFGIGVDYGINIFQRYRQEGEKDILNVIRHTGGAVILCSMSTIIGYSSLLIAGNQAFVSFGKLAVFGELTCIAAAIIALPAYLQYKKISRRNET